MVPFSLPTKIFFEDGKKPNEGKLVVEPCEAGFGTTLGNALRRVLLSSLPGAAITDVKMKDVQHEFSTLPGVKEDAVDIVLNLKQLRLRVFSEEPVRLTLHVTGEKEVTAADIEKNTAVEIVNPHLHLATLTTKDAVLAMELIAQRGRGYDAIESREKRDAEIGLLAIDALYTPVRNVGFRVDSVRVGQMTNYDRLTLTVETDGTMTGKEAIEQASKILIDHFILLTTLGDGGAAKEEAIVAIADDSPRSTEAVVAEIASVEEGGKSEEDPEKEEKKSKKKKKEE